MSENTQNDIRRLLKSFGIQADDAISIHIAQLPEDTSLHLRITLEDLTDYGGAPPAEKLRVEVEGEVRS